MVMDDIPQSEWCTCNPKTEVDGKEYPPKNGESKPSAAGDPEGTGAGNVAKLTGQGMKPDTT